MTWIKKIESTKLLVDQANAIAKKLGHNISGFLRIDDKGNKWSAFCMQCDLDITIYPRKFGSMDISGGAVSLRCDNSKKEPEKKEEPKEGGTAPWQNLFGRKP